MAHSFVYIFAFVFFSFLILADGQALAALHSWVHIMLAVA